MGRYLALLIALVLGSWIAFSDQRLPEPKPASAPATEFSAERAFADVALLAKEPHPIGSSQNARVRDELVRRMSELGLAPQVRPGVGVQEPKWQPDTVIAGPVENVVGVLPGRDRNAPALALMAHYDSVPGSPGAPDDIMGVAAALETVRALKARGQPARDVIVLITDGEEAGLLGANHFFRRDPLAKRIGLVVNLEARGSTGRANMFQTSSQNGELVRLFQRTAERPASSSLSVLIYEKMPNDTDLTESLGAGLAGLNYAVIGRQFDYHSATATPANLDRGSLQDMGAQVLALAGEVAFSPQMPGRAPSLEYSNLFGDLVIAYPTWFGWVLILGVIVLMALAVRWARKTGEFPATDILRGMGGLAFAALGAVAVLQFARQLTGAEFGFVEQRGLLAQAARWEWAVAALSLGFLLLAAGGMARGLRWLALVPLVFGLASSAFGGFDVIGAVSGGLAAVLGFFVYGRPANRKGAWAGALALGLLLAVAVQAFAPGAAHVVAWPLLVGAAAAAATALSGRRGFLPLAVLALLAAATLGWVGGIAHFSFEAMDLMPLFALPIITAGLVLWPLAQPDTGSQKGLVVGGALLLAGLALTLAIRTAEPWSPRYPQASYVGYLADQDSGRAWRFSHPKMSGAWTNGVLRADGGNVAPLSHFAWRTPMLAAPAPLVAQPAPEFTLARTADGSLRLSTATPPGARTLQLQLRTNTPSQLTAVAGAPTSVPLPAGEWVKLGWQAPGALDLTIRPSGPGRLDVRYVAGFDRWPAGVAPLPPRPEDLMAWGESDSTFAAGARAFTW